MDYMKASLKKHYEWRGKIQVDSRVIVQTKKELSLVYTPGVAAPCIEIQKDPCKAYELTRKWNTVAVITDGTAVLGLGDIGAEASMPVMEGKCVLFKAFADIDAFPLCIKSRNIDTIVETICQISDSFGGINLEDIAAPRCFEIERKLKERCNIPIFHDDQHGSAIVVLAALINALKITNKKTNDVVCAISGAGAAGTAIAKLLISIGLKNIIMCNRNGIIHDGKPGLNAAQRELAKITNPLNVKGGIEDAVKDADVFIGVSAAGVLTANMIKTMCDNAIIFAMANPLPEIMPDIAKKAGALIVGTGRSDFRNQINNALAFPGVFRGALDARASDINDDMKIAAAFAIANIIDDETLSEEYIIPPPFDKRVASSVAKAVYDAAVKSGVARI